MCIQIKEEKVNCTEGRETSGRRQYLNDLPWSCSLLLESDRIKNQARSLVDLSTPTKKRKSKDRIDLKFLLAVSTYVLWLTLVKPQAPSIMEILPHVKRIYDRFRAPHARVATSARLIGQRWTIFGAGCGLWVLQCAGEEFKVKRTVCSTPWLLVPGNVKRESKGPHLPWVLMTFPIGGMIGVKSKFLIQYGVPW